MGFKSDLRNDFAYVNGIGRFDIQVENNDQVSWALSKYFFPHKNFNFVRKFFTKTGFSNSIFPTSKAAKRLNLCVAA